MRCRDQVTVKHFAICCKRAMIFYSIPRRYPYLFIVFTVFWIISYTIYCVAAANFIMTCSAIKPVAKTATTHQDKY